MALIEIMASAFTQYRAGTVYAIPELPPIPLAGDIRADLNNKAAKWRWVTDSCYLVEESISKWIHTNLARISM